MPSVNPAEHAKPCGYCGEVPKAGTKHVWTGWRCEWLQKQNQELKELLS